MTDYAFVFLQTHVDSRSEIAPAFDFLGVFQVAARTSNVEPFVRALIKRRLRQLVEARKRGDVEGILRLFTPDCHLEFSTWRGQPFPVIRDGVEGARDVLRQVIANYENLGTELNRLLIDGDKVAVHRTSLMRNRGGGDQMKVDMWNFITFRGGKIAEFIEHPDTMMLRRLE